MGLEETHQKAKAKTKGKLLGRDVVWVRPSWLRREYTMLVDGEPTATMRFHNWYSRLATVDGLGERWTFDRKGIFRREILVEDVDLDERSRPFQYNWNNSGKLNLGEGEFLNFRHGGWGRNSYWENSQKEPIITFRRRSWWRFTIQVDFEPLAAGFPELSTLIFLGFYLRLLYEEDSSSS